MTERISCTACGEKILLDTARKTGGLCMPCKGGYRENIEATKAFREKQKVMRDSPPAKHWRWLVHQISQTESGFASLSRENQRFFAACLLEYEVYNGGFDQYFHNSSADYFSSAVDGLTEMTARTCCDLAIRAKEIYFGPRPVPPTQASRIEYLRTTLRQEKARIDKVEKINRQFWDEANAFLERAEEYAQLHGLYDGF